MTGYTITVDYDVSREPHLDDLAELAHDMLADTSAVVSLGGTRLSVILSTDSPDPHHALTQTLDRFKWLNGDLVGFGVMTDADVDASLDVPDIPPLVGAAEAADILGVSRQRVHELRTTNETFPPPAYQLRQGPLWLESAIRSWGENRRRAPGRPKSVELPTVRLVNNEITPPMPAPGKRKVVRRSEWPK